MKILSKCFFWLKHPWLFFNKLRGYYWRKKLRLPYNINVLGRIVIYRPEIVTIGQGVSLNEGLFIGGNEKVTIGNHVHISPKVSINTGGLNIENFGVERHHFYKPVIIEDGVWIGCNALINPGVTLGHDCVIGAGAVVTKDIPPFAVAVGVPAKVIRFLNEKGVF